MYRCVRVIGSGSGNGAVFLARHEFFRNGIRKGQRILASRRTDVGAFCMVEGHGFARCGGHGFRVAVRSRILPGLGGLALEVSGVKAWV